MTRAVPFVLVVFLLGAGLALAQEVRGRVDGKILDASGLPLPGVAVTLTRTAKLPVVVHTDEIGQFAFSVAYGDYTLTAELSGFQTFVQKNVVSGATPSHLEFVLNLGGFQEQTQVVAQAPRVFETSEPTAPATVDREIIKMAPVQGTRYDSALTLLPGAVRGPDGQVSVSGTRSWQGTVVVDHMRETDPFSGEPRLRLPITAVDNVQVYAQMPPAEAGPGTGGVTLVNTRAGVDSYSVSAQSLFPRPRLSSVGSSGIESWQPSVGFSGPLVKNRVWFAESFEYRYERTASVTAVGAQDSKLHGYSSFTRLDVKPSGPHAFTVSLTLTPDWNRHYGLNAFEPYETVPDLRTSGVSAAVFDRVVVGQDATLESHVHVRTLTLDMTAEPLQPYVVGHERVYGSYFRTVHQWSRRIDAGSTWSKAIASSRGAHLLRAGVSLARVSGSGTETNRRVDYLRDDGTLARRFDFTGAGAFEVSFSETQAYIQDEWTPHARVRLNVGLRWDANSKANDETFSPRATVSIDLRPNSTKLTGGLGLAADKPLLAALVFPQLPSRTETIFDATGQNVQSQTLWTNRVSGLLALPRARLLIAQLDQTFSHGWMLRAGFQQRLGSNDWVVARRTTSATSGDLLLTDSGTTSSRSIEIATGYRAPHGQRQIYASYVRAWADGDLNDLHTVAGIRAPALVLANEVASLAASVPHRVLAWGVISLPLQVTLSPLVEFRSGFPYTRIDGNWNVVGTRADTRFPNYVSIDMAVEKAVHVSRFPIRVGLKVFNITGYNNGRSVQRDVTRPDFGKLFDSPGRVLRGTLEIGWNK